MQRPHGKTLRQWSIGGETAVSDLAITTGDFLLTLVRRVTAVAHHLAADDLPIQFALHARGRGGRREHQVRCHAEKLADIEHVDLFVDRVGSPANAPGCQGHELVISAAG